MDAEIDAGRVVCDVLVYSTGQRDIFQGRLGSVALSVAWWVGGLVSQLVGAVPAVYVCCVSVLCLLLASCIIRLLHRQLCH